LNDMAREILLETRGASLPDATIFFIAGKTRLVRHRFSALWAREYRSVTRQHG